MDGVLDVIRRHERLTVCLRLQGILAELPFQDKGMLPLGTLGAE